MTRKAAIVVLLGFAAVAAMVSIVVMRPREVPPKPKPVATVPIPEPTIAPEPGPETVQEEPSPIEIKTPAEEPPAEEGASISGRVSDTNMNPIKGADVWAAPAPKRRRSDNLLAPKPTAHVCSDQRGNYRLVGAAQNLEYVVFAKATGYGRASKQASVPTEGDATAVDFALEKGAVISGRVIDTNRNCVANATVSAGLRSGDPDDARFSDVFAIVWWTGFGFYRFQAETGEDGSFEIADLLPGTYSFSVEVRTESSRCSQRAQQAPVVVQAGDVITGLELIVEAGDKGSVEGYARDDEGNGVPNAKVSGTLKNHTASGWQGWTQTDASGHYRLEGLVENTVCLYFLRKNYVPAYLAAVPVGTTDANVVMLRAGGVSGTVLDGATGAPLEQFDISMTQLGPREAETERSTDVYRHPDSRVGEFMITGIMPGVATFRVSAPDYAAQVVPGVVIAPGKITSGITVSLFRGGSIEGYVTRNGVPIPGTVTVFVTSEAEAGEPARSTRADNNGFYRLTGLLDTYVVHVLVEWQRDRPRNTAMGSSTVHVRNGQAIRLDFDMGGSAAVRGSVSLPEGCHATVDVVPRGSTSESSVMADLGTYRSRVLAGSQCRQDGSYEITDLPPGTYMVIVSYWGTGELLGRSSRVVTIKDGESAEVNFAQ